MKKMIATVDNPESFRYLNKYIIPKIGLENSTFTNCNYAFFEKDEPVTITDWNVVDGKYQAVVHSEKNLMPTFMPISKIKKDSIRNKGNIFEQAVADNLQEVGLMEGKEAGFSGAYDVTLKRADGAIGKVELKFSKHAVFGQVSLHRDSKGWDIREANFKRQPIISTFIRNCKCNGFPLLEVLTETVRKPKKNEIMRGVSLASDVYDFMPVEAYCWDKGYDILHFGKEGTFGITDFIPDLPKPEGEARVRIRAKHANSLTAVVEVINIKESPIKFDFFNLQNLKKIKKKYLGYGRD